MPTPQVSIIVPVLNEAPAMGSLQSRLRPLVSQGVEVIFVDGSSTDGTPELVEEGFKVITGARGRGRELNEGARAAHGDVLLFLHADCELPEGALGELLRIARDHDLGCFGLRFRPSNPVLRLCALMSNQRVAVRGLVYGDQGIFIRRETFFSVGGFPDMPFMEDLEFSLRLRKRGIRPHLARPGMRITASSRRFGRGMRSAAKAWIHMYHLRKRYFSGVPIEKLAAEYADVR